MILHIYYICTPILLGVWCLSGHVGHDHLQNNLSRSLPVG